MALKIKNREEAIAVLRDMVQRKKEIEKQVQEEFAKVRKEAENSQPCLKNKRTDDISFIKPC